MKFDRDELQFSHQYFCRNNVNLLQHIKRKSQNIQNNTNSNNNNIYCNQNSNCHFLDNKQQIIDEKLNFKPDSVTKVLQDVRTMRGRQDSLDTRLLMMKKENEALWREIASLRQKHAKQQQIVNKLLQFLITIVQPQRNVSGVKTHQHLMIERNPQQLNTDNNGKNTLRQQQLQILKEVEGTYDDSSNLNTKKIINNSKRSTTIMIPVTIPAVDDIDYIDNDNDDDSTIDIHGLAETSGPVIHELNGDLYDINNHSYLYTQVLYLI